MREKVDCHARNIMEVTLIDKKFTKLPVPLDQRYFLLTCKEWTAVSALANTLFIQKVAFVLSYLCRRTTCEKVAQPIISRNVSKRY